jgi:REP-associated tyrosine transposase
VFVLREPVDLVRGQILRAADNPLWQRYGYEHVLQTDEDSLGVAKSILENPVRAGLVRSPQDYEFSASPRYTVEDVLDAVSWVRPRSG